jgi:ubiquinone/menaquinone biosynthesis C-methylase UbiE
MSLPELGRSSLRRQRQVWNQLAEEDPLWAVLSLEDRRGNRWEVESFFESGRGEVESALAQLESLDVEIGRRRALDFGCGVGRLTKGLAEHFDEVIGVDIASSMIELAKRYSDGTSNIDYLVNVADDLRVFPDDHFDLVVSVITLQHMRPKYARRYLKEFIRVLRPGGALVFQLPAAATDEQPTGRRQRLIDSLPVPIAERLEARQRARAVGNDEMHTIDRKSVEKLIERQGGKVLNAIEDGASGPAWISYRYWVVK